MRRDKAPPSTRRRMKQGEVFLLRAGVKVALQTHDLFKEVKKIKVETVPSQLLKLWEIFSGQSQLTLAGPSCGWLPI